MADQSKGRKISIFSSHKLVLNKRRSSELSDDNQEDKVDSRKIGWIHHFRIRPVPQHIFKKILPDIISKSNGSLSLLPDNESDIDQNFGKYFRAVSWIGKLVMLNVFLLIYQNLDSSNCRKCVYDFCVEKLGWSKTKLKNVWSSGETNGIKKSPVDDDFQPDITLLYKIIINVLGHIPDVLINTTRELKILRNILCHEEIEISGPDLVKKTSILKSKIRTCLVELQKFTSFSTVKQIEKYELLIDEISMHKIDPECIKDYLDEIKHFRESKHRKLQIEGREELLERYSKITTLNPCFWIQDEKFENLSIEKAFIPVRMTVDNTRDVAISDIFMDLKQRFTPRTIIISGQMGSGKTSICKYILYNWLKSTTKITSLVDFDLVIYIEIKLVNCSTLTQLLKEQILPKTTNKFSDSDLIPALQNMNAIFILDGADEANASSNLIINEIITKFEEKRVIITTRPEVLLEIKMIETNHVVLELGGFDPPSFRKYVHTFFAGLNISSIKKDENEKAFLKYIASTKNTLQDQIYNPIIAVVLLLLWQEDSIRLTSESTASDVYHLLFNHFIKTNAWQMSKKCDSHTKVIEKNIEKWLNFLGKISLELLLNNQVALTKKHTDDLIEEAEKYAINPIQTLSIYMNCKSSEDITGHNYDFSFSHLSFQEFLSALYLANTLLSGDKIYPLVQGKITTKNSRLMLFTTGIIKIKLNEDMPMKVAKEIIDILMLEAKFTTNAIEFWWKLITESGKDPAICHVVSGLLDENLTWAINSWDSPYSMESKLGLLKETTVAPNEVYININYSDDDGDFPLIREILKHLRLTTKLYIFAEKQFHVESYAANLDTFIGSLMSKNNIIQLRGHGHMALALSISKFKNIKSLHIRISEIEVLQQFTASMRTKNRSNLFKFSSLRYLEIFLDIKTMFTIDKISNISFNRALIIKLLYTSDDKLSWVLNLLKELNHYFDSVIFMKSSLTLEAMSKFMHEVRTTKSLKIKIIRVFSSNHAPTEDVVKIIKKRGIRLGWALTSNTPSHSIDE